MNRYRFKTGEYVNSGFSKYELDELDKEFSWMKKYLGQLKGAVIRDVAINVDMENDCTAFPALVIELPNGKTYDCEILAIHNTDSPGFIAGLPYEFEDK